MADYTHPSSNELLAATRDPARYTAIEDHVDDCLACRVRFARMQLAHGASPQRASNNSVARILSASEPLAEGFVTAIGTRLGLAPRPNELWRVGRHEALLVWVRQVFDDGVADVIPVVFDTDLADEESVIIDSEATSLGIAMAAMTALRTHIAVATFINFLYELDIASEVEEVISATREGRPAHGVHVGLPISDSRDQRLEYRQALRDLLGSLAPSAFESGPVEQTPGSLTTDAVHDNDAAQIANGISERLAGVKCVDCEKHRVHVRPGVELASMLKVVYLDTAVLVATLEGAVGNARAGSISEIANACHTLCHIESDADAVAVAIPQEDWATFLFTTADMRSAFQVPSGVMSGPTVTMQGFDIRETLFKYLDAFAMSSWEFAEFDQGEENQKDLAEVARRHVQTSIAQVKDIGSRAHQPKRQAWTALPASLEESIVHFVLSVASAESLATALEALTTDTDDD